MSKQEQRFEKVVEWSTQTHIFGDRMTEGVKEMFCLILFLFLSSLSGIILSSKIIEDNIFTFHDILALVIIASLVISIAAIIVFFSMFEREVYWRKIE